MPISSTEIRPLNLRSNFMGWKHRPPWRTALWRRISTVDQMTTAFGAMSFTN
ncbi:hypothetical protein X765_16770 [Mesorhizobium sp. LSHC440B00]|nr:hypothetical protein X765_16770 [Mesorhizobium sp. LSHC440B00]